MRARRITIRRLQTPAAALALAALAPAALAATELAQKQSKLKGLLVRPLATGENAGVASQMNATATPVRDRKAALQVSFNQDVGGSMEGALKEVIKFLRVRHDEWPTGYQIEIAFEDRYTPKDGPSAATACALLLDSLITGAQMDPKFAVTGDMNADGSVQPVGGVPAKVRGAFGKHCEVVGVPAENARDLADLVITEGLSPVTRIQVFAIEDFGQAQALAAADKGADLKKAIKEFALVQRAVKRGNLRHPQVTAKLAEVLELAPNHLSAKILLDAAAGRAPKTLSLLGSLESVERAAATLLEAARGQRGGVKGLDKDELAATIGELNRVRSKLDRRTWSYADAIHDFGEKVRDYQNAPPRGVPLMRKKLGEITAAAERIENEVRKIRNDKAMMEELLQ